MPTDFLFWLLLILFQKLCQNWPKDDAEDCRRALSQDARQQVDLRRPGKRCQLTSDWLTQLSWAMPEQPIRSLQIQLSLAISFLKFLAISTISIYYFWFYLFIQVMSNMKRLISVLFKKLLVPPTRTKCKIGKIGEVCPIWSSRIYLSLSSKILLRDVDFMGW